MRTLLLVASLTLLGGCYKTNIVNFSASASPGKTVKVWNHAVIAGLIPLSETDVRAACGKSGVYSISTRANFWNLLLTGLTAAIYTPTTTKIVCRG